ncbi:sensor histidine kinase [Streptomyces litchfieldiae]|uniref:histidine kinase n=1 Tax=Streptomyces litchfieldiae TaxID=3075543 RepID=A0ABU2MQL9_9ACTN|nr:histidine kinase [Streptomyces sp. DSM 44938]MDT0343648.1 histidine kinase [Streptomyces sp. DSM 44938]
MRISVVARGGLAAGSAVWAVVALPVAGPLITLPAALAAGSALLRRWDVGPSAAVVSLAATAGYRGPAGNEVGPWWLVETAGLLALLVPVARRAAGWRAWAGCGLLVTAVAVLPLRIGPRLEPPSDAAELAVICLLAALAGVTVLAAGRYLGALDGRRARAVAEARRAQRLGLARDLHDFVAHEVSGMLAQAQAGQVVNAGDAAGAVATLRRIEEAGLRAMRTLDRTVRMLDAESAGGADEPDGPALTALAATVARFREGSPGLVELELDPRVGEVPALAHRVVVEALTNVRRHAPGATEVRVAVRREGAALTVSVVNSAPAGSPSRAVAPGGGRGLEALRRGLAAQAATLAAGPTGTGGWRTAATWPDA